MADWARAQSPAAVEEILDRENKRMADSLASKVTRLKSLALDIDRDAEDQNRYLDSMLLATSSSSVFGKLCRSSFCGIDKLSIFKERLQCFTPVTQPPVNAIGRCIYLLGLCNPSTTLSKACKVFKCMYVKY
ncbi:BET1-like protein isoform X1 [Vulpes vulpes]|uniref:BET1-like protein isoform X1 n=1 Tax=Vulpes vulpes TaxID=9627 RepID=A0A3Q7RYK8_VULVU|nr:BET1-like protein isoform X3 [Vulpes vulpes]